MSNKNIVLEQLKENKLLVVVRIDKQENIEATIDSLIDGGIKCIEISFTMPYAHIILEKITKKYSSKLIIGAGTILDSETARLAILNGAKFIVCPYFSENVIKTCNLYGVPIISGFDGISDIPRALELGVEVFKLFPAENYNINFIKDIKSPFPNIEVIAMGGVNSDNAKLWIEKGAFAVGVSGELMKPAQNGDFSLVKEKANMFVNILK